MGASGSVNQEKYKDRRIILFDGVCNLCNGAVRFIIERDSKKDFLFASLQSTFARQQLEIRGFYSLDVQTIVLLQGNRVLQRSDAALEIAKGLDGLWPLLYGFKIVPRFIRDLIYGYIAKNRYRFFGRQDECMIPNAAIKCRFIEI